MIKMIIINETFVTIGFDLKPFRRLSAVRKVKKSNNYLCALRLPNRSFAKAGELRGTFQEEI